MEAQPTAIEWLADRLIEIAETPPYAAHVVQYAADFHAVEIYSRWMDWYWRFDTYAIEVRGSERLHVRHVPVRRGTHAELRRLLTAAKIGSAEKYKRTWIGTSGKTLDRVISAWSAVPPPVIWREYARGRLVNFARADFIAAHERVAVGGRRVSHASIMPPQRDAVSVIQTALDRYRAIPVSERRRHKVDELADDLARAVCLAHYDLTGKRGITANPMTGDYSGGLFKLANAIEVQFDLEARWSLGAGRHRRGVFTVDRFKKFSRLLRT